MAEQQSNHLYVKMSGTPYERGVMYGKTARDRIYKVIEEYKTLFDKEAHMTWDEAYKRAAVYEEPIRQYRPDLIEEMKGIADGAGLDFQTILLLNSRSEVMFAKVDEDACSVIGVPPESSADGKTYLAQTWDWWSIGAGTTVLLEVEQAPYTKALVITEAGLVGGKGLNTAGIGVSLNALSVKKGKVGVPLHVVLRHTLSQPTLPKAIDAIAKAKRAGAGAIGIVSADGLVVNVEAAPNDLDILLCDGHPLCHTNHWLSPVMLAGNEASRYSFTSTYTRLDRIRRLTRPLDGKLQPSDLIRILSDHAGCPDSVCRHDDMTLPEYHRHTSLWCMVIDVQDRVLWLTESSPCCSEVRQYKLKD